MRGSRTASREIIRLCLLDDQRAEVTGALRRIVPGVSLTDLASAARGHGVQGYVLRRLRGIPSVHGNTLQLLRTLHDEAGLGHLQSLADLGVLAKACGSGTADWAVVGGPLLVDDVHDPVLRTSDPIDVILAGRAVADFLASTAAVGCHILPSNVGAPGKISYLATLVMPYGSRARLFVDVPLRRNHGRDGETIIRDLLSRAQVIDLAGGVKVRALDWADTLLMLASHVARDPDHLGRLKDVQRVIACHPPDWNDLAARARHIGGGLLLWHALHAARETLEAVVPDPALEALEALDPPRALEPRPLERGGSGAPAALLRIIRLQQDAVPPVPEDTWGEIMALAGRERIGSLLHAALAARHDVTPPQTIRALLAQLHNQARDSVAEAYGQLGQVLAALRATGCTPVLMKGTALARFVYADGAARTFADLDLLVPLPDVTAAHRALRQVGYVVTGDAPTDTDLLWRHGRGYFDPDGTRMPVDLHWRFLGYPLALSLDRSGIIRRATEVRIEGEPALLPTPADLVVAVCIAFLRECWYRKPRLRYLRDLAEITSRRAVDWELVLGQVSATHLLRSPVLFALAAAADLLDAPVPVDVLRALGSDRSFMVRRLRAYTANRVLSTDHLLQSLLLVSLMRWLDRRSAVEFLGWVQDLIFVPAELLESQRRWVQMLRER